MKVEGRLEGGHLDSGDEKRWGGIILEKLIAWRSAGREKQTLD